MSERSRRDFLADVGRGMLMASVGSGLALDMGLSRARADDAGDGRLRFGSLEPLVGLMQDTPAQQLMPLLVEKWRGGTDLRTMVAAGALANSRTFAGEDYVGWHAFMALAPAYEMSRELPEAAKPLPVLKVLYRNTARMQAQGGSHHEKLAPVEPTPTPTDRDAGESLRDLSRRRDTKGAEALLAGLVKSGSPLEAFQQLQYEVQDDPVDVHRIVLAWRAWSMIDLAGEEFALTLLRQSLRICLSCENKRRGPLHDANSISSQLPKLFDQYKLAGKPLGDRQADDWWIEALSNTVYSAGRAQAAEAVAAALAEGFSPEAVGEALALAANRLVLRDPGRREPDGDKPIGSVHGASVGVHASDAANAWRNIARVSNPRNAAASLIVGAYHTAGQSGGQNKESYPLAAQLEKISASDPTTLLTELEQAIRAKDQFRSCALATRYSQSGGDSRPVFDVLLQFATSEDGSLHAEKYYRTVTEEFARMRPAFRWRQVAALARVTASEFGTPAQGYAQAKELLQV